MESEQGKATTSTSPISPYKTLQLRIARAHCEITIEELCDLEILQQRMRELYPRIIRRKRNFLELCTDFKINAKKMVHATLLNLCVQGSNTETMLWSLPDNPTALPEEMLELNTDSNKKTKHVRHSPYQIWIRCVQPLLHDLFPRKSLTWKETFAKNRLWKYCVMNPESSTYNERHSVVFCMKHADNCGTFSLRKPTKKTNKSESNFNYTQRRISEIKEHPPSKVEALQIENAVKMVDEAGQFVGRAWDGVRELLPPEEEEEEEEVNNSTDDEMHPKSNKSLSWKEPLIEE